MDKHSKKGSAPKAVEVEETEIEGQAENVGHLVPVVVGSQSVIGAYTYEVESIIKKSGTFFVVIFRADDEEHNTQEVRIGSNLWTKLFPNGTIQSNTPVKEVTKKKVIIEEKEPDLEFPDEEFEIAELDGALEQINEVKSEAIRAVLFTSFAGQSDVVRLAIETCSMRDTMPFQMETFEKLVLKDNVSVKRPKETNIRKLTEYAFATYVDNTPEESDYLEVLKVVAEEGQAAYFAMVSENGWNLMGRPKLKQSILEAIVAGFDDFDFKAEAEEVKTKAKAKDKEEEAE